VLIAPKELAMMRILLLLAVLGFASNLQPAHAQEKKEIERVNPRFTVIYNADVYPQAEPKETLESAIKAIERNRLDYLIAHLIDPAFIDLRMAETKATLDEMMAAVKTKMVDDPNLLKQFKLFLKEGDFADNGQGVITVTHKELKDRKLFLKKIGQRYFLQNERTEPAKK
jgi:hypothetical protein